MLFVVFTLMATVTASGVSYFYSSAQFKSTTEQQLLDRAISYGHELNEIIFGVETAVNTITAELEVAIDNNRIFDPAYYSEIHGELEALARKFDQNDINATSFYIRFDPKLSSGTSGVFHADINSDNTLEQQQPTDISIFDPSDREHVGWFYEPMTFQKGDWMKPYLNANINTYMVSYVAPLIINGTTIGIVGMDIDFATLNKIADEHQGAGKVVLIDREHAFMVHSDYSLEDRITTIDDGRLAYMSEEMYAHPNGTLHYSLNGTNKVLGYTTLRNQWTLIVTLTEVEAFDSFNQTTSTLLRINLIVSGIITLLAFLFSNYVYQIITRTYSLERQVEERTQQLTKANQYLEATVIELEKSNQAQIEMQDRLIEAEKLASLGELVAGIAHELNTPVGNAITLNSFVSGKLDKIQSQVEYNLLTKRDLSEFIESLSEAFQLSQQTLYKILGLVQHFKLMTLPEQLIDVQRFKIVSFIKKLAKEYESALAEFNHKIIIEGDEELEVISSPVILEQIMKQLFSNSLTHGFEGMNGNEINIAISFVSDKVQIVYTDNGRGLSSDIQGKAFNPFVSSKKNKGYIGLGLHMVYNLVTQTLGGTIKINEEISIGFGIILTFEGFNGETSFSKDKKRDCD